MSDNNAPVDEALDMVLVEMAEACVAGNLRATANAVRKAHARLFAASREKLAKSEAVVTAAKELDENMCQSCLLDGEHNQATGRTYTGTCGHRKKLRKALAALDER